MSSTFIPGQPGAVGTTDVIVVGGGLAGLTAANLLVDSGLSVVLLEAVPSLGGRASTDERDGHLLNRGGHAIYEDGPGLQVLTSLGIDPRGGNVRANGACGIRLGRSHILPVGPVSLMRTRLLTLSGRVELGRLLGGLGRLDPHSLAAATADGWIDSVVRTPEAKALLGALIRLSTYSADLEVLSAEVAVTQLKLANGNIRYLHGGWQSLVDLLARRAENAGAQLRVGTPVRSLEHDGSRWVVQAEGLDLCADQVLLALANPDRAARLSGSTSLSAVAGSAVASSVSCLDLGLRTLPVSSSPFALGIDEPTYVSVHSAVADLGPGAMIHAMRYGAARGSDASGLRGEMEAALDLVQPGWRDVVDVARFLPFQDACSAVATAAQGGFAGRQDVKVEDREGLYVAGDWVGPVGHLADASLASARRAVEFIVSERSSVPV